MYHISDLKRFVHCPCLHFYSKSDESVFRPYLRSDESISDLIKEYLGIEECFEGVRNDASDRFFNDMANHEWFMHTRLADGNMRVNIPVMHKLDNGFEVYFIHYGTKPKEIDLFGYRVMTEIMDKLSLSVCKAYIIYLDGDYVNEGKLDVHRLFKTTDTHRDKDILSLIREKNSDYESIINKIEATDPSTITPMKSSYCRLGGLCSHYHDCFPEEEDEDCDSILTLVSSRNKNTMHEAGIRHLKDADLDLIEGNRVQYAQVMASRNGGLFVDSLALKEWLDELSPRPISFIDFEWDRYLVPTYYGMHPLDVVCFEFALYYIDENGNMEHRTFVGTGDCRREFVEGLIEYLPKSGPILAYNAQGAECLRLEELSEIFPEYRYELLSIVSRFVDLATPFIEGLVYDTRMEGNYTLKKLVDICSDYNYKDLDIYDGMEAVYNWRNIGKTSDDLDKKIVDNLKEYCSLDAYGLFLVYRWLIELIVESK